MSRRISISTFFTTPGRCDALCRIVVVIIITLGNFCVASCWISPSSSSFYSRRPSRTLSTQQQENPLVLAAAANKKQKQQYNQQKRAFAQPAFSASNTTTTSSSSHQHQHSSSKQKAFRGDSRLAERHAERVQTAGRVGTKRFVNPCQVFVGNLPYNVTETELQDWLCNKVMGLPPKILLHDVKIVRDWKTGKSKGYGFVVFTEAVYATACLEKCSQAPMLHGRALTVGQGRRKPVENQLYVTNQKKKATDAQEEAIQAGLQEAQAEEAKKEESTRRPPLDPEEVALLRRLDPDLLDEDYGDMVLEEQEEEDDILLDEEDTVTFEEDDSNNNDGAEDDNEDMPMNRAQRREAARRNKRRKLPRKGFGS